MLLSDEEIDALADDVAFCDGKAEAITIIREAVRLTAERCALICEEQGRMSATLDGQSFYIASGQCAAAIRERAKSEPA